MSARQAGPGWGELVAISRRRVDPLIRFGADPETVARHAGGRPVYVATPYTRLAVDAAGAWDILRSRDAQRRATVYCAQLTVAGATPISPVMISAEMFHHAPPTPHPLDHDFWMRWCRPLLSACGVIAVPEIPGWAQSDGIWAEVLWALARQVPVFVEAAG